MTGAPEELERWTAVAGCPLPSVLVEALLKRSRVPGPPCPYHLGWCLVPRLSSSFGFPLLDCFVTCPSGGGESAFSNDS